MAGSGSVTDEMEADIFSYIDSADQGASQQQQSYASESTGDGDPHAFVSIVDDTSQNNQGQQDTSQGQTQQTQQVQQSQGQQNSQQQTQQQGQPQKITQLEDGTFRNQRGDVVDAQGNLVATRGTERRLFEKSQRIQNAYEDSQRDNQILL